MEQDDIDRVDELRLALWGPIDDGSRRLARRIAVPGCDAPAARRVQGHRVLREAIRGVRASRTPPHMKAWLRRTIADRAAPVPESDITWITPAPMFEAAGMRGISNSRLIACAFHNWELRARVEVEDGDAGCAVTGTLRSPRTLAPLPAYSVALYVDLALRETALTDGYGEFAFDRRPGTVFGLRVGEGVTSKHLTLIDVAAEAAGPGPSR